MTMVRKGQSGIMNLLIILLVIIAFAFFILGAFRIFGFSSTVLIILIIFGILYVILIAFLVSLSFKRRKILPQQRNLHLIKKIVAEPVEEEKEELKKGKFIGTTKNKKYHVVGCRFTKRIEPEYAVYKDSVSYFKRNGFVACKSCKPDKA